MGSYTIGTMINIPSNRRHGTLSIDDPKQDVLNGLLAETNLFLECKALLFAHLNKQRGIHD